MKILPFSVRSPSKIPLSRTLKIYCLYKRSKHLRKPREKNTARDWCIQMKLTFQIWIADAENASPAAGLFLENKSSILSSNNKTTKARFYRNQRIKSIQY